MIIKNIKTFFFLINILFSKQNTNKYITWNNTIFIIIIESKEENARAKETAIIKLGEIYSTQKLVYKN